MKEWDIFQLDERATEWASKAKENLSNFEAEMLFRLAVELFDYNEDYTFLSSGRVFYEFNDREVYLAENCVPIIKEFDEEGNAIYSRVD